MPERIFDIDKDYLDPSKPFGQWLEWIKKEILNPNKIEETIYVDQNGALNILLSKKSKKGGIPVVDAILFPTGLNEIYCWQAEIGVSENDFLIAKTVVFASFLSTLMSNTVIIDTKEKFEDFKKWVNEGGNLSTSNVTSISP